MSGNDNGNDNDNDNDDVFGLAPNHADIGAVTLDAADVFTPLDPMTGMAVARTVGSPGWSLEVDDCTG